ncbi:hypothetical protein GNI_028070 [Gregarina niphandrodes]|uniref:Uncharacterized protein n=1 Tax=Gregarina niphandrodes TaxID=110365 RepID=A0A023BB64_GRENI|nr:hypothetical protein GNI_028070 [Gregarina niphandrodes]EZG79232.1 hypothetical protein GNI_028070 [Gregarina niphandrodes]|eukprot:XP_011129103.1 hypothetical protein GNI_028070 [Gregarina niphandrodes]
MCDPVADKEIERLSAQAENAYALPVVKALRASEVTGRSLEDLDALYRRMFRELAQEDVQWYRLMSPYDLVIREQDRCQGLWTFAADSCTILIDKLATTLRLKVSTMELDSLYDERQLLQKQDVRNHAWAGHAERTLALQYKCRKLVWKALYAQRYHRFELARKRRNERVWTMWYTRRYLQ